MLVYKPNHSTDGPNPKLIHPWRGPYIICSKLSPVVYRIRHLDDTKQVSVHLAHIKSYRPRQSAPAPDFHKLEGLFLGKTLPTPALEESETVPPYIGIYQVADVVGHRRRQGRHSPHNYIYCLRLKGFCQKLTSNTERTRSHNVKNLWQHTALNINLRQSRLLLAISGSTLLRTGSDTAPEDGSPLESELAIRKRPCNTRKHPASKDGNPPGSDAAPKVGNPPVATPHRKTVIPPAAMLHRKTVIPSVAMLPRKTAIPSVAMPHRKTVVPSKANPLFASANPDLARIKRTMLPNK